jgi:hypothetical protein
MTFVWTVAFANKLVTAFRKDECKEHSKSYHAEMEAYIQRCEKIACVSEGGVMGTKLNKETARNSKSARYYSQCVAT